MTRKTASVKYNNIFSRLFHASLFSIAGLAHALKHEQAFRYEFFVFVMICAALIILPVPPEKSLLLAGAWVIVMCLELVNSAAEKTFDLIDKNFRPEIKAGKDMLSAAVFLAICFNIFLWLVCIIFA